MSWCFLQTERPKPFRRCLFLHSTEQDLWILMAYHHKLFHHVCMPKDETLNEFESKEACLFDRVRSPTKAFGWECSTKKDRVWAFVVAEMLGSYWLMLGNTRDRIFSKSPVCKAFGHSPLSAGKPHPVHPLCKRSFHASVGCIQLHSH